MSSRYFRTQVSPNKRVVVTGIGMVSPLGLSLKESWKKALEGQSGIANITRFSTEGYDVHFAGEVKNFDTDMYVPKKEQKKMDTFIHYAMGAAQMAFEMSGLPDLSSHPELAARAGCLIGVGLGGLPVIEEQHQRLLARGPGRISPFFIPMTIANLAAGQVSIKHGLRGVNYSVTSACASGAHALGEAMNYIRHGHCDVMVAGGAESTICGMALGGFASMGALSTRNEDPTKASRPFDKNRNGFVLAEGSAVLVLESLEHAEKRGAPILCELSGYGASGDAYHMTTPSPEGIGATSAMMMAIRDSGVKLEQIQYINAHGTSTPVGDELESLAIKSIFGPASKKLWVSSTKSMTGHTLGAAGAIEAAFCVMSIKDQIVAPTINLEEPSESCDLDYVPHEARTGNIQNVLNNSFGFGGTNACLVFSRL